MDGLGARERSEGGRGKKKGFEKEGGVGGERMPTTSLQCCDTRARARTASRKGWGRGRRERERELHGEWKEDTEKEEEQR